MKIKILTPESLIFEGEVHSILLPGEKGDFHIMKNHASIISTLKEGYVRIFAENVPLEYLGNFEHTDSAEFLYKIKSGVVEFDKDNGVILCEV